MLEELNSYLNTLIRPEIRLFRRSRSAFQVCGYTGLALGVLVSMTLMIYLGLSPWVMGGIVLTSVLTFFGLTMTTRLLIGAERLTNYYHQVAATGAAAALLWILRQPVLSYLDVMVLGLGLFMACGRVGCLMVGCCHGRPHRWGICYREEHADAGFTSYFVGVRLFPIQAVESLWVLIIVCVGVSFILRGQPPGTTLAWYIVAYAVGRFCFEFARGDAERPYFWGFSRNQWISLILTCAVVWTGVSGIIGFEIWYAVAAGGLFLAMIAVASNRRFRKTATHHLLHPRHIKEVAEAVERLFSMAAEGSPGLFKRTPGSMNVQVECTSFGVQISASKIRSAAGSIFHYAFFDRNGTMSEKAARTLTGLILQLRHRSGSNEIIRGNQGVFHLLIYPLGHAYEHISGNDGFASAGSASRRFTPGQPVMGVQYPRPLVKRGTDTDDYHGRTDR